MCRQPRSGHPGRILMCRGRGRVVVGGGWQESGSGDGRWCDVAAEWAPGIVGPVVGKWTSKLSITL